MNNIDLQRGSRRKNFDAMNIPNPTPVMLWFSLFEELRLSLSIQSFSYFFLQIFNSRTKCSFVRDNCL